MYIQQILYVLAPNTKASPCVLEMTVIATFNITAEGKPYLPRDCNKSYFVYTLLIMLLEKCIENLWRDITLSASFHHYTWSYHK